MTRSPTVRSRLHTCVVRLALGAAGTVACAGMTFAQPPQPSDGGAAAGDAKELAKATQNPVGDLISLPFQFNFNTGGDMQDRVFFNVNFQPVVPFRMTEHWNAIARTIVPIDSYPVGAVRESGLGDLQEQVYFTSAHPGSIIWGAGPVFSFPTATVSALATGTWAFGPGLVVVTNAGDFVLGGLVNQLWPISDSGADNKTDLFLFQPFINYNFGEGWAIAFAPSITANWDASSGNEWTVPLGAGLSRTTVFGGRPISLGVQYYYNVKRPDGSPKTVLRFQIALLFPKARPTGTH